MIILMLFVIMIVFSYWLSCSPFKWRGKGIDWMIPWPLFGNTAGTLTSSYFDYWLKFSKRAKDQKLIGFHFFAEPALFINDSELIKQILVTESDSFKKRIFYWREDDMFKKNLFSTFGDEAHGYRSKTSPFFSPTKIKDLTPILQNLMTMFIEKLEVDSKKGPVTVDEITTLLSTDAVITCIFGLEPECFKNSNTFFIKLQKQISGFLFGFRLLIGLLSPKLYDYLGLTALTEESTSCIRSIVKQIVELRTQGIGIREDFMQGMLGLYKKEMETEDETKYNSDGTKVAKFDLDGLVSQGMIMFLAGTDTVGHALAFLLYELAKNPDIQDKLREEVQETIKSSGGIGYEQLQSMVYLDMNFKETLRLYPVAPFIPRRCTKSITLNGFYFEEGVIACIAIHTIHRSSKYFPNPNKFDPENFKPGKATELGSYFPFGMGPRMCVGPRLAEVQIKLAICSVLSKFKILPSKETPDDVKFAYGPLVGPGGGLKLIF